MSCGEKIPYDRLLCGKVSPHEKCEENISHRKSSPHDKYGANCVMWRNMEKSVMWRNMLFCCKICFVAIYALFVCRKIEPKIVLVEKKDKYQVWFRVTILTEF